MTTCQWAGVGGCKWPGDWFSHRLSKWFCRLHKVMVASADVGDQDPPRALLKDAKPECVDCLVGKPEAKE